MTTSPSFQQILASNLYKLLQDQKGVRLIDVRTPEEYSRGKIEGSINLPLHEIASQIQTVFPDKQSQIVLYCLSGSRSDQAASLLQEMGYQHVSSLKSGLLAWRSEQLPLI